MRKIAQELGVVPMALYKHVAGKDELLDGMIDVVVGEIDPRLPTRWSGKLPSVSGSSPLGKRCSVIRGRLE
jgi:AcrR family transcriptional regulator